MNFKLSLSFTQYVPKFSDASARIKNKQLVVRQSNFHAWGISTIFYVLYTRCGNGSSDAPEFNFNSNLHYSSYEMLGAYKKYFDTFPVFTRTLLAKVYELRSTPCTPTSGGYLFIPLWRGIKGEVNPKS